MDWKNTAISMVDACFQQPAVEKVQRLLDLGYKISYQTWPPLANNSSGIPLPSTHVWEGDFGGNRLREEYGLIATLCLLDEVIAALSSKDVCRCSSKDLLWFGCRCV